MKAATICLLAVLAVATSLELELGVQSSLTFDAEQAKNRPIGKVIKLLKDMLKTQEKEGEEDQKAYDELACWLITNIKEKTESVAATTSRISDLETSIENKGSQIARLDVEVKGLNTDAARDQLALDTATEERKKQLKEFNIEEKDLLQSTYSVKNAVTVLSKHTAPGAFLQTSPGHVDSVATTVQDAMQKHSSLLAGVLTPSQREKITAFVQAPKYDSQSGEIFGILKQMQETFETNLQNAQKDEKTNSDTFQDLKTAKENEIKAGQDQADSKSDLLAGLVDQLAQDKENLADNEVSLAADEKELANLKEHQELSDREWEVRTQTRSQEKEATSKALAVLSSDDAHELATRTFNPSFLQTDMHRRAQVAKLFSEVAQKVQNPRFSAMATQVRINAFTKVTQSIKEMIVQLGKEKADEIKQRDFCISEFQKNDKETIKKTREKEDVEALIAKLTATMKKLKEEVDTLQAEIAEMQKEMKAAGEDRVKQNSDFKLIVADQRATQKLLNSALNILKGFYAKKAAASAALVQTEGEPPAGPKTYKKNAASGGVMGMMKQIVVDAKAMEVEATADEAQALKEYNAFVATSNASIKSKKDEITNKKVTISEKDTAKTAAGTDLESVQLELEILANTKKELHESCDFQMKNFEVRQKARDEEVEALKQAKSILKGSK